MKRIFRALLIVVFALFMLVASIPTLISTNILGRPLVTFLLKQVAPFQECSYDSLSIGWWTSFRLKGFKATLDTPDNSNISIKECTIDRSLFNLLLDLNNIGTVEISDPVFSHSMRQIFGSVKSYNKSTSIEKKQTSLPYLSENIPEDALKGHIIVKNSSVEIKDGKGQLLFKVSSPLSECTGALDLTGPLAISSFASIWDGVEGSNGSLYVSSLLRTDTSLEGTVDIKIPSLSLKLVNALLQSYNVVEKDLSKCFELLGGKAFLSCSLKDNKGFLAVGVPVCNSTINFDLKNTSIAIHQGSGFKVQCSQGLYNELLTFSGYRDQVPVRLLQTLQLQGTLTKNATFNWATQKASNLVTHITSPDTLWSSKTTSFYSNLDVQAEYEATNFQSTATITIKKDLETQESSILKLACTANSVTGSIIPFTVQTSIEGGFIANLVPEPYTTYVKALMQPHFTYNGSLNGTLGEPNALNVQGEFIIDSSLGKKQAKFKIDQETLKISDAFIEVEALPQDLSPTLSGELSTISLKISDLTIPFTKNFTDLLHTCTFSGKGSVHIPSLSYTNQKIVDGFLIEGAIQKNANEDILNIDVDQSSKLCTNDLQTPLLACIPSTSAVHLSYNVKSGDLSCKGSLSSQAIEFQASLTGLLDYQNMKFQAKEPWLLSLSMNDPAKMQSFLPATFKNCTISVSPFKASVTNGALTFAQAPNISGSINGICCGSLELMDVNFIAKYGLLKKEWTSHITVEDTLTNDKLASLDTVLKEYSSLELKADLLPSILPYIEKSPIKTFFPLFDGLKTCHLDCTIEDIQDPLKTTKTNVLFLSDRVEVNGHLHAKNKEVTLFSDDKKNLLTCTIDPSLCSFLKKNGLVSQSVEISVPVVVSIPSCTFKSIVSDTYTPTSLDGDLALHVNEIRLKVQDKKCLLNPFDLALHVENKKKAVLTFKSTSPLSFENHASLFGDCTATYKESLQTISLENIHLKGSLSLQDIPAELIQPFCPKAEILSEALSPTFTITSAFTSDKLTTGDIQFHLKSPSLSCDIDSSTIKNGSLLLTSPLTARFKISKKKSQAFFKKLSPFICSSIDEDEHQILLTIAQNNTSIPLSNFSIQDIQLPSIVLDIGKVDVKSSGVLKSLIHILHPKESKTVPFWPTKVHSSLQKGIYKIERVDCMVANLIHLFLWGDINLVQKNIDMKVAISPETFNNLRLYISLPRPVTVGIHGTLDSPSVDTARLTTRLAGAGAATLGAATGALEILGSALQLASTVGEDTSEEIPAPYETPFPWEKK